MDWESYKEGYDAGFANAMKIAQRYGAEPMPIAPYGTSSYMGQKGSKPKRKLSAWQKFVKVNAKKPRFKFKSGSKKGKINLKALGVAYRKTPAGKKRR